MAKCWYNRIKLKYGKKEVKINKDIPLIINNELFLLKCLTNEEFYDII